MVEDVEEGCDKLNLSACSQHANCTSFALPTVPSETASRADGRTEAPPHPSMPPCFAQSSSLHAADEWAKVDRDITMEEFWTHQSSSTGNMFNLHGHTQPNFTSTPNENWSRISENPWAVLTTAMGPPTMSDRPEQPAVQSSGHIMTGTMENQRTTVWLSSQTANAAATNAPSFCLRPVA